MPFLERAAGEVERGAAALVGEDGEFVDDVGMVWPAGWDDAGGGILHVLLVKPGDDVVEPGPQLGAETLIDTAGWYPRAWQLCWVAESFPGGFVAVGGEIQVVVCLRQRCTGGHREGIDEWLRVVHSSPRAFQNPGKGFWRPTGRRMLPMIGHPAAVVPCRMAAEFACTRSRRGFAAHAAVRVLARSGPVLAHQPGVNLGISTSSSCPLGLVPD